MWACVLSENPQPLTCQLFYDDVGNNTMMCEVVCPIVFPLLLCLRVFFPLCGLMFYVSNHFESRKVLPTFACCPHVYALIQAYCSKHYFEGISGLGYLPMLVDVCLQVEPITCCKSIYQSVPIMRFHCGGTMCISLIYRLLLMCCHRQTGGFVPVFPHEYATKVKYSTFQI